MKQKELFLTDFERRGGVIPFAPKVTPPEAQIRMSQQCHRILNRLRRGPAYTGELRKMAAKYTGRISDIRAATGLVIKATPIDRKTGVWMYTLQEKLN